LIELGEEIENEEVAELNWDLRVEAMEGKLKSFSREEEEEASQFKIKTGSMKQVKD